MASSMHYLPGQNYPQLVATFREAKSNSSKTKSILGRVCMVVVKTSLDVTAAVVVGREYG